MNKLHLLCISLLTILGLQAQENTSKNFLKRPTFGVHFSLTDFNTADLIRKTSINNVLLNKLNTPTKKMVPGISLTYSEGLTNHVDIQGRLSASFLDLPIAGRAPFYGDFLLTEADASFLLKMLSDKYWVTPYLNVGIGASMYKGTHFGAYMPIGGGLQINFYDEAFLLINSQYRVYAAANNNYHFFHSIGFAGNIGKPRNAIAEKKAVVVEVPKDTDGDGIFDKDDDCPTVGGIAKYKGCPVPDSDKDGINDEEDKCPTVYGIAKNNGCPVIDTDKDGINDEEDKCVNEAGEARYQGCPIPDTDKDGINDEEDKCKDVAGVSTNQGCPEIAKEVMKKIEFAAKNILFESSKSILKKESNKPLNDIVKILKENPELMLDIEGHTDNSGVAEKNVVLSQDRANTVLAFLKSKGIDEARLTATGFGPDQPVADNKTVAGRAKNRRVELKLRSF
jgi:OmpA-OmpF porin, OOP family